MCVRARARARVCVCVHIERSNRILRWAQGMSKTLVQSRYSQFTNTNVLVILRRADHSSRGVLPSVVRRRV